MIDQEQDKQLIMISGPRNSGKSWMAGTYANPSKVGRVYYNDSENSANNLIANLANSGLKLGYYNNLGDRFSDLPGEEDLLELINKGDLPWVDDRGRNSLIEYYKYIVSTMAVNLTPGKFDVYIMDTIEKMEAGMVAWVKANKKKTGWAREGYGELWVAGVFPLYQQFIDAIFARGVKTIIFTSHLKTPWKDKQQLVGKVTPSGKKLLHYLSSLYLWLVNDDSNGSGAPAALVLKERMGKLTYDKKTDEWITRRVLPYRIPVCTWKNIREYLNNKPADLQNPAPGEMPSQAEKEMVSEMLTDKQMELQIAMAYQSAEQARSEAYAELPVKPQRPPEVKVDTEAVKALVDEGLSAGEIAKKLGIPVPKVLITIKGMQNGK